MHAFTNTIVLFLIAVIGLTCRTKGDLSFTHFVIDHPLPGEGYGTGGFTLADYDSDGDLDITLQRRSDSTVYWYAYINDSIWQRHIATRLGGGQLGATSYDVNQDGDPDLIMGRAWIENPGQLKENPDRNWPVHFYSGGMMGENHDIIMADLDRDGLSEVIAYSQTIGTIRWYKINDPLRWQSGDIASGVNDIDVHAGFAPHGAGDLNGDTYPDILMPFYWYENPGRDLRQKWTKHKWNYREITDTPYGRSFRSWIVDLDADGDNDMIVADCDVTMSRAYWYENREAGKTFREHPLPLPDGQTGSFHSLVVADFDRDQDLDIFLGEQEDNDQKPIPGMKPIGLKERGILLINAGSKTKPRFKCRIIHQDNPGWHDTRVGDVDGDGDLDLVTKIWNADEEGIWHADYWRNDLIMRKQE